MITHFNIITVTLNYVINFEFQKSFNCLALKVIYIHFLKPNIDGSFYQSILFQINEHSFIHKQDI
jgi:hypothetical protein